MNAYTIMCPKCHDNYPEVINCENCYGSGKIVIQERRRRLKPSRWPRYLSWAALVLVALGALAWGWFSR